MNSQDIKQRAAGRWIEILYHLAPAMRTVLSRSGHGPCPVHGGKDGCRAFADVALTGGTICATCGSRPDGFATLMWINEWTFVKSLEEVERYLEAHPAEVPVVSAMVQAEISTKEFWRRLDAINKLRVESLNVSDPAAEPLKRYLRNRGLSLDIEKVSQGAQIPNTITYHPALDYFEQREDGQYQLVGTYPAMLTVVCDASGRPVTVHRTYLTKEGAKAPVKHPKKLMSATAPLRGGAIRLCPVGLDRRLAIAEGIETALAVHEATGIATWSVVCATGMETFNVPDDEVITEVLIYADNDANGRGQEAARTLASRLLREGYQVKIAVPSKPGQDWLDVLNEGAK